MCFTINSHPNTPPSYSQNSPNSLDYINISKKLTNIREFTVQISIFFFFVSKCYLFYFRLCLRGNLYAIAKYICFYEDFVILI